jgi:hypothetical protein
MEMESTNFHLHLSQSHAKSVGSMRCVLMQLGYGQGQRSNWESYEENPVHRTLKNRIILNNESTVLFQYLNEGTEEEP